MIPMRVTIALVSSVLLLAGCASPRPADRVLSDAAIKPTENEPVVPFSKLAQLDDDAAWFAWKFPGKRPTSYRTVELDGTRVLEASTDASASVAAGYQISVSMPFLTTCTRFGSSPG